MAKLVDEMAELWVQRHENASKEAANHLAMGLMASMIGQWLRKGMAEAAGGPGAKGGYAGERLESYAQAIDALTEAQAELAANVNLGLVCDHLVSMLERAIKTV